MPQKELPLQITGIKPMAVSPQAMVGLILHPERRIRMNITGKGFMSGAQVSLVRGEKEIALGNVSVVGPEIISCDLFVPSGTERGGWDLKVVVGDRSAILEGKKIWVGIFGDIAPVTGPDGKVTVGDATVALRTAIGLRVPKDEDLVYGDVAPVYDPPNHLGPDGKITVGDATRILRAAIGLVVLDPPMTDIPEGGSKDKDG